MEYRDELICSAIMAIVAISIALILMGVSVGALTPPPIPFFVKVFVWVAIGVPVTVLSTVAWFFKHFPGIRQDMALYVRQLVRGLAD